MLVVGLIVVFAAVCCFVGCNNAQRNELALEKTWFTEYSDALAVRTSILTANVHLSTSKSYRELLERIEKIILEHREKGSSSQTSEPSHYPVSVSVELPDSFLSEEEYLALESNLHNHAILPDGSSGDRAGRWRLPLAVLLSHLLGSGKRDGSLMLVDIAAQELRHQESLSYCVIARDAEMRLYDKLNSDSPVDGMTKAQRRSFVAELERGQRQIDHSLRVLAYLSGYWRQRLKKGEYFSAGSALAVSTSLRSAGESFLFAGASTEVSELKMMVHSLMRDMSAITEEQAFALVCKRYLKQVLDDLQVLSVRLVKTERTGSSIRGGRQEARPSHEVFF